MTKAFRVEYKGYIVDVIDDEIFREGMETLRTEDQCDAIMESVTEALDGFVVKMERGIPVTEEERQNFCDDVGIWLANEMNHGRGLDYEVVDEKDFKEPFSRI